MRKSVTFAGFALMPVLMPAQSIFQVVSTPNGNEPPPANNYLYSISASSPADIWAGGLINIDTENKTPNQVIERWKGTDWSVFPGPDFNSGDQPSINGMAGISPSDMWTAGSLLTSDGLLEVLFEHWDGTAWTAHTGPLRGFPEGISADAPNDIWAVGYNPGGLAFTTAADHYVLRAGSESKRIRSGFRR